MNKFTKILLLFLFSLSLALSDTNSTQEVSKKVVIDLTTGELKNFEKKILSAIARNKAYYEGKLQELQVAVVIHGDSYKFFLKDIASSSYKDQANLLKANQDLQKRISFLAENYEVEFLMCAVGVKNKEINPNNIYPFVTLVANSTIGLIDKQSEGYAYIPVD